MNPEALILRRCYPVPVTFADLRAAWENSSCYEWVTKNPRTVFTATLKQVTGAIDEVYAVVDGREVRVAVVSAGGHQTMLYAGQTDRVAALLEVADEQGYWERPHEVRLDLSPRPVSHGEVARAVLVGQGYLERLPIPAYRAMAGKTSIADAVIDHMLGDKEQS